MSLNLFVMAIDIHSIMINQAAQLGKPKDHPMCSEINVDSSVRFAGDILIATDGTVGALQQVSGHFPGVLSDV